MQEWLAELTRGRPEVAWDRFLDRYRRLILAAIRHYLHDHDDVMDVFAAVCEALRKDDFARLRRYAAQETHRARFGTWLVAVVRHLTVDWLRHRDGRHRLPAFVVNLPDLQRHIYESVFLQQRSYVESYELISSSRHTSLSYGEFLREIREMYRALTRERPSLFREAGALRDAAARIASVAVSEPVLDQDTLEAVRNAVDGLAPQDRVVIELYVIEGLAAADVARVAGFPNAKAVYNRVYRLLQTLRESLERVGVHGAG